MTRARISTTVDRQLLDDARRVHAGTTDAELVDEALTALLRSYRSAEIDAAYAAPTRTIRWRTTTNGVISRRSVARLRPRESTAETR